MDYLAFRNSTLYFLWLIDINREVVGRIGDFTAVYAFANVSLHDSDFRSSFPEEDGDVRAFIKLCFVHVL